MASLGSVEIHPPDGTHGLAHKPVGDTGWPRWPSNATRPRPGASWAIRGAIGYAGWLLSPNRPGPALRKRDCSPFVFTSRISAEYSVFDGVLPVGLLQ